MSKSKIQPASFRVALLGAAAFAAFAGSAAAQAAPASAERAGVDASAEAETPGQVEEVVVTARHRTETAQNVPAALSVVGGDFIAKTNTTNITQLVRYIPSVQFTALNPRNSSINIRGLGNASGVASDGLDPGVGFYVDQVYYNRPATTTFDLVDIDQVEVLRGPQGTLYGKNTTAGAISITTASPTFTPEAKGEISGGSYGYFVAKGSVSGPLVDGLLAGRLSVASSRIDGLVTNDFDNNKVNGSRNITVRSQLLYTPSQDLKVRVIGDYSRQVTNCCYNVLAGIVTPPNGKNFLTAVGHFGYAPTVDPFDRHADSNSPAFARQETGGVSIQADYSLPGAVLSSITAWRFWNWAPGNDVDSTPLSVFNRADTTDNQNQVSQEFRIASTGVRKLDYVAGLYYFREQVKGHAILTYGDAASYLLAGPAVPALAANGYGSNAYSSNNSTSYAAYGQATWHLTSQWSLTGGLRYTHDDKKGNFLQLVGGGVPLTGALAPLQALRTALAAPAAYNAKLDDGKLSGQAGVSYQATENVLAYANLARGYRSGGINLVQLPPGATPTIQPESIDSAELGVKTRLFDRRLTLNVAAFYERDKNYQGTALITGTTKTYLTNIPRVESKGVEVDIQAQPTTQLSLYASATYDDAAYKSFPDSPCGLENILQTSCDLSGSPLTGVPRWAASFGGEFRQPFTLGSREVEAYVAADDSFRSSIFSNSTNTVYSRLPNLNLVDARLGVRAADGRWDAFVWGKNILDKEYFTQASPGLGNLGSIYASLGDPATWGVTLRGRY